MDGKNSVSSVATPFCAVSSPVLDAILIVFYRMLVIRLQFIVSIKKLPQVKGPLTRGRSRPFGRPLGIPPYAVQADWSLDLGHLAAAHSETDGGFQLGRMQKSSSCLRFLPLAVTSHRWLACSPNVHYPYTPVRAWINYLELLTTWTCLLRPAWSLEDMPDHLAV